MIRHRAKMNLAGHRVRRLSRNYFEPCINNLSFAFGPSCGMRYPVTSYISPRIYNLKKKTLCKLLFDILNAEDDCIDTPRFIKKVKLAKTYWIINSCLLVSTFTIYLFNSFFFTVLSRLHESILQFLFNLFANCKLSFIVSLSLNNFILCTYCPASNSPASCGQSICNIICLLINSVVVVMESQSDHFFTQHHLGHRFQDLGS